MQLLALDFDGVIADSAPEAFVVALRTWCELDPTTELRGAAGELLDETRVPSLDDVMNCPVYAPFIEMMPLGNRAEDYAVELHAIGARAAVVDQATYDAHKAGFDPSVLRTFQKRFYRVRHVLAECDRIAWHRLMDSYPDLPELLRRRAGDCVLAIATAKDRRSVRMLLDGYRIADLFPESRVLDKEAGASKRAHLEALRVNHDLAFEDLVFVDDKLNHLDDVADLGVKCALAGWGYNGPREARLAESRGYRVLQLDDFEAQLFGS